MSEQEKVTLAGLEGDSSELTPVRDAYLRFVDKVRGLMDDLREAAS